jgi:hypothetical protein
MIDAVKGTNEKRMMRNVLLSLLIRARPLSMSLVDAFIGSRLLEQTGPAARGSALVMGAG